jgi:hypothetical protein
MKARLHPGVAAAIVVVAAVAALYFGFQWMNGGPNADVTQARLDFYRNQKGPTGGGGNTSAAAPNGKATAQDAGSKSSGQ